MILQNKSLNYILYALTITDDYYDSKNTVSTKVQTMSLFSLLIKYLLTSETWTNYIPD